MRVEMTDIVSIFPSETYPGETVVAWTDESSYYAPARAVTSEGNVILGESFPLDSRFSADDIRKIVQVDCGTIVYVNGLSGYYCSNCDQPAKPVKYELNFFEKGTNDFVTARYSSVRNLVMGFNEATFENSVFDTIIATLTRGDGTARNLLFKSRDGKFLANADWTDGFKDED